MADAQANININLDASQALAQLRALQAEISTFQQKMLKLNASTAASAANVQRNLLNTINATGKFSAGITTVASSTETFTNSLEKNKFSMGEYFRYAGGASKTFGKLFTNEFNTIEKVARERVKTLQTQYIKLGRDANGAMKAISVRPLALDMDNLATKTMIAAQKQQILNQLLRQGSTNLLNWGKNTQWAGRQLMVGFTIPLTIFGSLAAKTFMELEEQAIRFKRVYGELFTTQEETDKMLDQLKALGSEFTKYGVALKDTMAMAADAAAMGKTGVDLLAQVSQASRLAVLGGVEQQQALETTISLTNAFGVATEDLTKKIDFLNAVENQTVVSIEDLTIAIPKAGPVVKQLGGDVEDLAFFLTAMKEGGINASEGANALKSGLASLINPSGKASEMLAGLGININAIVEGNAGDIKGTVIGFAKALDTLDPLNRARAIEQMFGKFQFSRLSTLFQNVVAEGTQASRVLGLTAASTEELAILSERELKRIESSPLFKFRKSFEDLKVAMAPVGEEFLKAVTPIIEFGTKLLEKFNSMSDGGKQFVTILVAGLGVVAPTLLMIIGLVGNGVANIAKFMLFLKGMGKGGAGIQQLGMQTEYMTQQQLEANAAASALSQTHSRLQQTFTSETAAVKALAAAYREAAIASRAIMGVPTARGGRARGASKPTGFANGVLSVPGPKGAGDVVPAMLSPGEAVIPAKQANKYAGFISSIMQDKVPGFFRGVFLGMPKPFSRVAQNRTESDLIASRFIKDPKIPVAKYGHQIEPTSGRSFPIPGVGGVYAKADGSKVFVKPFTDKQTALAEMRASEIARKAHGLLAPQHTMVRIPDPTDMSGKRTFYALESKLDPTFANPTGKFTKGEMVKQLLASLVRADKDLSPGNMFGRVLTDPGPAGVFSKASGYRDFAKPGQLPSLAQQAEINLLGVKGGARKFFAQSTSDIARSMTPKQYQDMMIKEIDTVLPKLKQTIAGFNLKGAEKAIYDDMIKRLEAGRNVDWTRFHKMHSDVPALPPRPLELAEGIFSVPGPKGAGDVVPAMLSPGEAVIPEKQSRKHASFIQSIIADKVPGYYGGLFSQTMMRLAQKQAASMKLPVGASSKTDEAVVAFGAHQPFTIAHQRIADEGMALASSQQSRFMQFTTEAFGKSKRHVLPLSTKLKLIKESLGFPATAVANPFALMEKLKSQGISKVTMMLGTDRMSSRVFDEAAAKYGITLVKKEIPRGPNDVSGTETRIAIAKNDKAKFDELIASRASDPTKNQVFKEIAQNIKGYNNGVLSVPGPKGAGDVVPAMLSPGEAVIPAKQSQKYSGFIQSMIADNVPGFKTGRYSYGGKENLPEHLFKIRGQEKGAAELARANAAAAATEAELLKMRKEGIKVTDAQIKSATQLDRSHIVNVGKMKNVPGAKDAAWGAGTWVARTAAENNMIAKTLNESSRTVKVYEQYLKKVGATQKQIADISQRNAQGISLTQKQASLQGKALRALGSDWSAGLIPKNAMSQRFGMYARAVGAGQLATDQLYAQQDPRVRNEWTEKERLAAQAKINALRDETAASKENTTATRKKTSAVKQTTQTSVAETKSIKQTNQARSEAPKEKPKTTPAKSNVAMVNNTQARKAGENIGNKVQESVVQGVKESTKQTSPSKAAKKSGANIGTGAIQGIESAVDDAKAAGTKLGQAAASGVAQSGGSQSQRGSVASRIETKVNKSGQTYYVLDGKRISEDKAKTAFANQERARRGAEAREAKRVAEAAAAAKRSESARKAAETRARNRADRLAAAPPVAQGGQQAGARGGMGMGGVGMLAMTAGMMAPMLPGKAGEVGGQLAMPLMALGMLSMLPPKIALVLGSLAAIAASIYAISSSFNKASKEAFDLATSLGSGTKAMQNFSNFAGTVSAGEIMDRRRESMFTPYEVQPGKTTFGAAFVQSEDGVAMLESLKTAVESQDMQVIQRQIIDQMATAVATGALSAEQARSVVYSLSQELGDISFGIEVNGKLTELIGPNGENLVNDPLKVRVQLMQEGQETLQASFDALETSKAGEQLGAGIGSSIVSSGLAAAIGAKIGAVVGTVVAPGVGTAVGTGVGAVVGGTVGFLANLPSLLSSLEDLGAMSGAINANSIILVQQRQQLLDSLDIEYEKRIENAKAAGDLVEAERLIGEQRTKREEFLTASAGAFEQVGENYGQAGFLEQGALSKNLNEILKTTFADSPLLQQVAAGASKQIENIDGGLVDTQREYQLKLVLASGEVDPSVFSEFIANFGKDGDTVDSFINVMTNLGTAEGNRALQVMKMFEDKTQQTEFLANIGAKTPAGAKKYLDMFLQVAQTGAAEVVDLQTAMTFYLENEDIALDYEEDMERLREQAALGPIETTFIQQHIGSEVAAVVQANQEYFDGLTPTQQVTYIQTIRTVFETVTQSETDSWLAKNPGKSVNDMMHESGYQLTQQEALAPGMDEGVDPPSGGGAEPKIDSLLKKLRDLRLATIDMKKGWEGMQEVLESVFAGGTKGIDVFEGLSNQIRKMGVGENLIEMIIGMDPDEYTERKNELFVFDKAGNIVGTTAKLKNMQSAFNAIAIGEYVNEQQRFIENAINQSRAISILTANGMSLSEAYELVQDEALAAAIAMGATKAEIQEIIKITSLAQQQRQNMEKEQETSRISESVRKTNEEFKNQVAILSQLSKAQGQYSDAQIKAILGDTDLQKLFLNPSIDPKALQEALNNANKQADLELKIKKLTVDGQEEIFQTGLSAAMSAFSAKEQEINIEFRATIADDESLIKSAENQLAKIDFELDDYQAALQEISWAEQKINDSYKDRFDALSKVSELNDQITASKARQLDLADALSRGDIAAAAKAAQEMRSQEQTNAIETQRTMMETAQQTEIARLRSSGGLSRDQIDEKILQLEKERFGIEENTIEPAQERIRLEEIQRDLRVADLEVLGKTRDEWEAIGNRIDVAQANGWKFADAMQEALNIVETLVGSLLNRPVEVAAPAPASSGGGGGGGGNNQGSSAPGTVVPTEPDTATKNYNWTKDDTDNKKYDRDHQIAIDNILDNIRKQQEESKKPVYLPPSGSRSTGTVVVKPGGPAFAVPKGTTTVVNNSKASNSTIASEIKRDSLMAARAPARAPMPTGGRQPYTYSSSGGMIIPSRMAMGGSVKGYPMGGLIPYKAEGGFFKSLGSDTVPAMLTPGEFVVRRPAVTKIGVDKLEQINRGTYEGNSVYNYNLEVNVKSSSNPNEIANTVMRSIKQVEGRRIRGNNL